jgi:hypothetical protein
MMDRVAPRPVPAGEPSDEDIIHSIQMKARDDRHFAIAWSLLRLVDAIREHGKPKAK